MDLRVSRSVKDYARLKVAAFAAQLGQEGGRMGALAAEGSGLDARKLSLAALALLWNAGLVAMLGLAASENRTRRRPVAPAPIYLIVEPRALLLDERPRAKAALTGRRISPAGSANQPETTTKAPVDEAPVTAKATDEAAPVLSGPPPSSATPTYRWTVRRGGAAGRAPRADLIRCASPQLLDEAERAACRDVMMHRAEGAPPIGGSGDADRDNAFARDGARRLAQYEALRQRGAMTSADQPGCQGMGPITDCGAKVTIELFSSRDGWLPNQRKRRE